MSFFFLILAMSVLAYIPQWFLGDRQDYRMAMRHGMAGGFTFTGTVLENVCPNCGGGFVRRPIRPLKNWKGDNYLGKDSASTKVKHRPVDPVAHAQFAATIRSIPPDKW